VRLLFSDVPGVFNVGTGVATVGTDKSESGARCGIGRWPLVTASESACRLIAAPTGSRGPAMPRQADLPQVGLRNDISAVGYAAGTRYGLLAGHFEVQKVARQITG